MFFRKIYLKGVIALTIQFRNYTSVSGITEDYYTVRAFLIQLGYAEYTYTRWDWMSTHSYLDKDSVGKIGLWEDEGKLVGIATFDCRLGQGFCLTLPGYEALKKEMLLYAEKHLSNNGAFEITISDTDHNFQRIAAELGFIATTSKESDAIFLTDQTPVDYELPEGFKITSMKEDYNLYQYYRVLWKGFNHEVNGEGDFVFTEKDQITSKLEMDRPHVDLSLKIAVVDPNGNFVSYCGMWYDPEAGYGVIEPVATDPEYRKMGMGKAVVLEGIKRVRDLGAKKVFVGSSQQFYYSIGMRPFATATLWKRKEQSL